MSNRTYIHLINNSVIAQAIVRTTTRHVHITLVLLSDPAGLTSVNVCKLAIVSLHFVTKFVNPHILFHSKRQLEIISIKRLCCVSGFGTDSM